MVVEGGRVSIRHRGEEVASHAESAGRRQRVIEPGHLAGTIALLKLNYVVVTSVDRDDLKDGGAQHFVSCIAEIRKTSPATTIEILVPDFRGRLDRALGILAAAPPDVMNHNLETVPRLYKRARPGGDYAHSLKLLETFKDRHAGVPTKSGLMVGLGETDEEILAVMRDLRAHGVDMLTIGQYLQPSPHHLPVERYVHPDEFSRFESRTLATAPYPSQLGFAAPQAYCPSQAIVAQPQVIYSQPAIVRQRQVIVQPQAIYSQPVRVYAPQRQVVREKRLDADAQPVYAH